MDWFILGIDATTDKEAIKAAYRNKLKTTNPEDKPEEFKALRNAYEEAMKLADMPAEDDTEKTPVDLWMDKVESVYCDFKARLNVEEWKALFRDDICIGLDTRMIAEEKLFTFLMVNWYLPQDVWQLINDEFSVAERHDELCERFNPDFIDNAVIDGARFEQILPFDMFEPGVDAEACDALRTLSMQLDESNPEQAAEITERIKALPESHPHIEVRLLRMKMDTDEDAEAKAGIAELARRFPDDAIVNVVWCQFCRRDGDWDEHKKVVEHLAELYPEDVGVNMSMAEQMYHDGDVDGAKDLAFDMMDMYGSGHPAQHNILLTIREWNEKEIARLEAEAGEDQKLLTELAWCYIQNDRVDDAVEIAKGLTEDGTDDIYGYHNILCKVALFTNDNETAYEHARLIAEYLLNLEEDGTEKTTKRIARRPEFLQIEADCLMGMGREDEAVEILRETAEAAPENADILMRIGVNLYTNHDYQGAAEYIMKATELAPDSPTNHYLLARAYYAMNNDREAFEEVNTAMEIDGSHLEYYTLKLDILIRNGAWDAVDDIMNMLGDAGFGEEPFFRWYQAQIADYKGEDNDTVLAQLEEIAEMVEAGGFLEKVPELYNDICWHLADGRDVTEDELFNKLIATIDKGLAFNKDDAQCLYYKAWLLQENGRDDEALEILHRLENYKWHSPSVENLLGSIYYKNLEVNAEKALKYYTYLQNLNPDNDINYFFMGHCYRFLRGYEMGEKCFLKEIELAPEDNDGYRGLSFIYEYNKEFEKAVEAIDRCIELVDDTRKQSAWYFRKHRLYLRMRNPEASLLALDECDNCNNGYYYFRAKYNIYATLGMWQECEQVLEDWLKSNEDMEAYYDRLVEYHICRDDMKQARRLLKKNMLKMDQNDVARKLNDFATYTGDYQYQIDYWKSRIEKNGDEDSYSFDNLARIYRRQGNSEAVEYYAKRIIEIETERMKRDFSSEAMHRTRIANAYIVLDRFEEAREQLELARKYHMCEHCNTATCKDADMFEIYLEEFSGNMERAAQLAREGWERFPDETDFLFAIKRFEREGY